jgi:NAD-dependent deacetylase sirtuin 4
LDVSADRNVACYTLCMESFDRSLDADEQVLAAAMALAGRRLAILTGAGVSTDSGIPDYRGEGTRHRSRQPVRFADYVSSEHARKRYWARAFVGWPRIRDATPNITHHVVGELVRTRRATGCITQNVDGLHQRGGADVVVELHGALRWVRCLQCARMLDRDELQQTLSTKNAGWQPNARRDAHAPDGDVDLDDDVIASFSVVDCVCGGALKPAVVFFGENVAADTLSSAWQVLDAAQALLVLGTSLEVYSGRRFVMAAASRGLPVVLVTRGPTRADDLVTVKIDGAVGQALEQLFGHDSGLATSRFNADT